MGGLASSPAPYAEDPDGSTTRTIKNPTACPSMDGSTTLVDGLQAPRKEAENVGARLDVRDDIANQSASLSTAVRTALFAS